MLCFLWGLANHQTQPFPLRTVAQAEDNLWWRGTCELNEWPLRSLVASLVEKMWPESGQKVAKTCPKSGPGVSQKCSQRGLAAFGTLLDHSQASFGPLVGNLSATFGPHLFGQRRDQNP